MPPIGTILLLYVPYAIPGENGAVATQGLRALPFLVSAHGQDYSLATVEQPAQLVPTLIGTVIEGGRIERGEFQFSEVPVAGKVSPLAS